MIAVEHLPFNFGEKVYFINYCQKALNQTALNQKANFP